MVIAAPPPFLFLPDLDLAALHLEGGIAVSKLTKLMSQTLHVFALPVWGFWQWQTKKEGLMLMENGEGNRAQEMDIKQQ